VPGEPGSRAVQRRCGQPHTRTAHACSHRHTGTPTHTARAILAFFFFFPLLTQTHKTACLMFTVQDESLWELLKSNAVLATCVDGDTAVDAPLNLLTNRPHRAAVLSLLARHHAAHHTPTATLQPSLVHSSHREVVSQPPPQLITGTTSSSRGTGTKCSWCRTCRMRF